MKVLGSLLVLLTVFAMESFASEVSRQGLAELDEKTVNEIKSTDILGSEKSDLRMKVIKEHAVKVGAQRGYGNRIAEIHSALNDRGKEIDRIYNFSYLMAMSSDNKSEVYLIPPIVEKFSDIAFVDMENNSLTTIQDKYVITKPARLVTTPPDWRQYLLFMTMAEPATVPATILPETTQEKQVWKAGIYEGWKAGEQIAEREMLSRMETLVQDFRGIIIFNRLADKNLLARPELLETKVPVTGDSTKLIQNQTTYKIVSKSKMQLNSKDWKAQVLDNRSSMIFPEKYKNIEVNVN